MLKTPYSFIDRRIPKDGMFLVIGTLGGEGNKNPIYELDGVTCKGFREPFQVVSLLAKNGKYFIYDEDIRSWYPIGKTYFKVLHAVLETMGIIPLKNPEDAIVYDEKF